MLVAVVPGKADRVLANGLNFSRTRQCLKHRQRSGHRFKRIAWRSAIFVPLFLAERAWASVAQKDKAIRAAMAVFPLDLHTRARGLVDLNRLGIRYEFHD